MTPTSIIERFDVEEKVGTGPGAAPGAFGFGGRHNERGQVAECELGERGGKVQDVGEIRQEGDSDR